MGKFSKFAKHNFTELLITAGFVTFAITIFLYFGSLPCFENHLHEIHVNKNKIIDNVIASRVESINKIKRQIYSLSNKMVAVKKPTASNTLLALRKIDTLTKQLTFTNDSSLFRLQQLQTFEKDSFRKYRSGFTVKLAYPDSVYNRLFDNAGGLGQRNSFTTALLVIDTVQKNFAFQTIHTFQQSERRPNVDFFLKYPLFGLWALGVAALVSVWMVLLLILLVGLRDFLQIINQKHIPEIKLSLSTLIRLIVLAAVLVVAFVVVVKYTVYDKRSVVPGLLFTNNYLLKFDYLHIAGLVFAIFYFGGYIIMGRCLKQIALSIADTEISTSITSNQREAKLKDLKEACILALENLEKYFLATAMSLAAVVLVIGLLFNAVNSLEFSQFYFESSGKKLLNSETVYLFGGLYSLLILLFYLPLRLTFSRLRQKHEVSNPEKDKKPFYTSKDFWSRLMETLTVSSPLLAGLLQTLLQLFTN